MSVKILNPSASVAIDVNEFYVTYFDTIICCDEMQHEYICKACGTPMGCQFCEFDPYDPHEDCEG